MGKDDISQSMYKKHSNLSDKTLDSVLESINLDGDIHKTQIPPLDQWQPERCGKMDLCIHANHTWWHEGTQIQRDALIQLFSHILCKEESKYYLKTPVEKIEIEVEDAPLCIRSVEKISQAEQTWIYFHTTDGDVVVLGEKNRMIMRAYKGEMRPYVYIRYGLYALIPRSVFFHLIEMGELIENDQLQTELVLQSGDFCLHLTA
ncbi:DUF1285 domain-containing protein [Acinetobacter sp. ESL0695]|uniref:DUF1285 domain-containing protein n=1 Tax=Acinetobacter sp. ESL0695 TaxID=2983215 RepID=UPI0023F03B4A|nr:DUF1285 domain-containing protein [Acinetobacter sp. ESL0695]WEV49224.1 DUF1285 domain-containing protein [Acinetobacter sp. ESL0695]